MLHSSLFWFILEMVFVVGACISMWLDYEGQSESHPITTIALLGAVLSWAGLLFISR